MIITAHFNSADSADFAAGALKRVLSPLTKIETDTISSNKQNNNINIFPVFNFNSTTPTYSVPVYIHNQIDENSGNSSVLQVICRKDEVSKASRIIIGFGGRNITKI